MKDGNEELLAVESSAHDMSNTKSKAAESILLEEEADEEDQAAK